MENDEGVVLRTMKGHGKDVTCASCSLTLKLLATSGADGHILVWNYGLGLLEGLCKGHSQDVTHLAFLEPYPALLSADILGNVCVWGMPPGPVEHRFSTLPVSLKSSVSQVECLVAAVQHLNLWSTGSSHVE
jgi:WD40 repeat protein